MKRGNIRYGLVALILAALAWSCGGDKASPAGPTSTARAVAFSTPSSRPPEDADWIEVRGKNSRLSLPSTFEGGSVEEDVPFLLDGAERLGDDFAAIVDAARNNPDLYDLIAWESAANIRGPVSNVLVTREKVISTIDLNDYADILEEQFPSPATILNRQSRFSSGFHVIIFETSIGIGTRVVRQRIYLRKEGGIIWGVAYSAMEASFERLADVFDESYATFEVVE